MLNVKSVASYFIEQSSLLQENDLTNLKLQKILFYAQAETLHKVGVPLFNEPIEAWKYGPVVPQVYEWLKGCGAYPITAFDVDLASEEIDPAADRLLSDVWSRYNKYSAGYLVDKTHAEGSPWKTTYDKTRNNEIPIADVKNAELQASWEK